MAIAEEMRKVQLQALTEMIYKRNSLVEKVNAATGDRDALVESIENSDDEDIASLRVAIAEMQEQLDAKVNARVDEILAQGSEGAEEAKAEVLELDKVVKAGVGYYKQLYGKDAAEADIPKIVRLRTARTGGGGGGRRIRGYNVVVTVGDEVTEFDNFASAAKYLGADTATLQEQFFAKAGVEKLKDAPDEVTFNVSWTEADDEGNESTGSATVKAYRTGESGVPSKDDAPESEGSVEVPDEDELDSI